MANSQEPIYTVYSVTKRDGKDDWWIPIGAAFAHADGEGLNVLLQALPINGKLVLRPPKDSSGEAPTKNSDRREERRRER